MEAKRQKPVSLPPIKMSNGELLEREEGKPIPSLAPFALSETRHTEATALDKKTIHVQNTSNKPTINTSNEIKRSQSKPNRFWDFFLFMIFLLSFVFATYMARGDENTFYLVNMMKENIVEKSYPSATGDTDFASISRTEDVYYYISYILLPFLLDDTTNIIPSREFYVNGANKLLGGVRLRQLRVRPNTCDVPEEYDALFDMCYGSYSEDIEYKEPIGISKTHKWTSANVNEEPSFWGNLGVYSGGGYVVDLPLNLTKSRDIVIELQNDKWIDNASTRLVVVDFTLYNPAWNVHFVARLSFEYPSSGGIKSKTDIYGLIMNRYAGMSGTLQIIFEVFTFLSFFLMLGWHLIRWFHDDSPPFQYWNSFWNIIDLLLFLFMFIIFGMRLESSGIYDNNDPVLNQDRYIVTINMAQLMVMESYTSCVVTFLLWLRLFKFLKLSPRLNFLTRTFSKAAWDLITFSLLFFIFFFGFAHCGYLSFNYDVSDFRSLTVSFMSLARAMMGDLDYHAMQKSSRVFGPLYFIVFQVLVLLILINVFLAIMNESYAEVKLEDAKNPPKTVDWSIRALWTRLKAFLSHDNDDDNDDNNNKPTKFNQVVPHNQSNLTSRQRLRQHQKNQVEIAVKERSDREEQQYDNNNQRRGSNGGGRCSCDKEMEILAKQQTETLQRFQTLEAQLKLMLQSLSRIEHSTREVQVDHGHERRNSIDLLEQMKVMQQNIISESKKEINQALEIERKRLNDVLETERKQRMKAKETTLQAEIAKQQELIASERNATALKFEERKREREAERQRRQDERMKKHQQRRKSIAEDDDNNTDNTNTTGGEEVTGVKNSSDIKSSSNNTISSPQSNVSRITTPMSQARSSGQNNTNNNSPIKNNTFEFSSDSDSSSSNDEFSLLDLSRTPLPNLPARRTPKQFIAKKEEKKEKKWKKPKKKPSPFGDMKDTEVMLESVRKQNSNTWDSAKSRNQPSSFI